MLFAATADALDEEMRERVERHRRERPEHWHTIEVPRGAGGAIRSRAAEADVIVVDCLSFLVANAMGEKAEAFSEAEKEVESEVEAVLRAFEQARTTFIIVSNEAGMGVVPAYPSGRLFRDLLGRANQRVAEAADRVYWMIAGLPVEVKASGLAERWEDPRAET